MKCSTIIAGATTLALGLTEVCARPNLKQDQQSAPSDELQDIEFFIREILPNRIKINQKVKEIINPDDITYKCVNNLASCEAYPVSLDALQKIKEIEGIEVVRTRKWIAGRQNLLFVAGNYDEANQKAREIAEQDGAGAFCLNGFTTVPVICEVVSASPDAVQKMKEEIAEFQPLSTLTTG